MQGAGKNASVDGAREEYGPQAASSSVLVLPPPTSLVATSASIGHGEGRSPHAGGDGAAGNALVGTPYQALKRLGRGGQAEVFLAKHREMGSPCVVKLPHAGFDADDGGSERWLQEARILARLDHPHIVRVLHTGRNHEGRPFIALELLQGETLQERLARQGRLAPDTAVDIGIAVALGLEAAHRAGVVHRDLKPENLFLHDPENTGFPEIKILDFGIAKVVGRAAGEGLTRTGRAAPPAVRPLPGTETGALRPLELTGELQVLGTPRYLSPEQIIEGMQVDGRADLYALGLILFTCVAGEGPFDALRDVSRLLSAHVRVTPERVSAVFKRRFPEFELPFAADFDRILGQALRKTPAERFADAARFREALETLRAKLESLVPFEVGQSVGKYRLELLLGRDQHSSVWQARDPDLERGTVVKILEPEALEADASADQRDGAESVAPDFERDARVLASIRHPNVVGLYDFGRARGRPWVAMEVARGEPLRRLLAGGVALPTQQAVLLALQMAAGVGEVHRRGVIHGNLSAANVFVSLGKDPRAVVSDFGTTQAIGGHSRHLDATGSSQQFAGALAYQAPELVLGHAPTPASDVFSLGVVLYQMLAGRLPFQDLLQDAEASARAQLFDSPPALSQLVRGVTAELSAVVARALQRRPGDRFASMDQFAQALQRALRPSRRRGPWLLATRPRALLTGAAAALALSGVVALLFVDVANRSAPKVTSSAKESPASTGASTVRLTETNAAPQTTPARPLP